MMVPFLRFMLLFLVFFQALDVAVLGTSKTNDELRILLLNSYHRGFKWTDDITQSTLNYFTDTVNGCLYVEYMDSKYFQDSVYFRQLSDFYRFKYQHTHLDGIICSDNNALDFIIRYGQSIWGKLPVTFCGINNALEYKNKLDTTLFKGVDEKIDIHATLKVARLLQPNLEEFLVIGDSTILFPLFYKQFVYAANSFPNPIRHRLFVVNDLDELRHNLDTIRLDNKAVYLLSLYTNTHGFSREMAVEARSIFEHYPVPVYGNWDFLMPDLIVGGRIVSGRDQGSLASKIMHSRLKHPEQTIPFVFECPQNYYFDYRQLTRFDFNTASVSVPFTIVHANDSFFIKYKTESAIGISVLMLLIVIISLLISSIIQRKKAELELIRSENRLELALEVANQGLWDANLFKQSVFINKQFSDLIGYSSPKELHLTTQNWQRFIHPEDQNHILESFDLHRDGKTDSINCEIRLIKKNGETNWFAVHGKITEWMDKNPMRITGSILNIQAQKEFEEELLKSKQKAEESDRLKSSFLANMSHEIRTPMNAIVGFADLILSDSIDDHERKSYLSVIKSSGESLLNLINDIIDISKIESNQLVLVPDVFDLHQLINNLEKISRALILNTNKSVLVVVHKGSSSETYFVKTDPYRLEQVLLNLITNAIKFTHRGQIDIGYIILDNNQLKLFVKDTGIGISEEHKKIIFERFRQGDESLAKRFGGTGLGLAISKHIVSMLGGKIEVESEPGKGSCFSFTIQTTKH